jgi:hypothetical protein
VREHHDVAQRQQRNAARTPLIVLAFRHPNPDLSNASGRTPIIECGRG